MSSRLTYLFLLLFISFHISAQTSTFQKAKDHFNLDSNIYYFEQYIEAPNENDSLEIVEAYCRLANKYLDKSLYTRAEKLLHTIQATPFAKSNNAARGFIEMEYGNLSKYKASYAEALQHYLSAENYLQKSPKKTYLIKCYIDMAEYFRKITQNEDAREYIQKALTLIKSNPNTEVKQKIRAYNRAAAIENESGNVENFKKNINISLQLAKANNDLYSIANSYNQLGFTYKNQQLDDTAIALYNAAEKIWFSIGADKDAINAMNNRARLYAHRNYPVEQTFAEYKKIISKVKEKNIDYPLKEIYLYLWVENIERGDTNKAFIHLYNYHAAMLDETKKIYDTEITNIKEKYENEKVKKEYEEVSGKLSESEVALRHEKEQNFIMLLFILISIIFLTVIALLAFRLNGSKNKLKDKNEEKDILLKEIHHRVKNNLQTVSSLLELQTQKTKDQQAINVMLEGQNRVKAMALVHKKLYQNENLAKINLQEYTEELCAALYHIYKNKEKQVDISIKTNGIILDIDTAIPLGLIINELASNSFKYAFNNTEHPQLKITLQEIETGIYNLKVIDNGPGLPSHIDLKNPSQLGSLGLMLVHQLTLQLFGKIEYTNDETSCFSITFKDTLTRKLTD